MGVFIEICVLFMYCFIGWINIVSVKETSLYKIIPGFQNSEKLNEAAVRYAERSEQMFEQQKQFIGNASHEMQTPLAICRNRLEMLMEDENLSESQLEELMKTHQTLEHITKLNKSLLLLSKIENGQFTDTVQVEVNKY